MRPEILIVDDEPEIRSLLTGYLGQSGYQVAAVADGTSARDFLSENQPLLIVLDLKLPDIDGLELAREIRAHSSVPIIMLTGVGTEIDRVVGLELAADDYLSKPFSPRELLARIKAVLRRTDGIHPIDSGTDLKNIVKFAGWTLDLTLRKLFSPRGELVQLTNSEFNLLVAFVTHPNQVLSRDQLLDLSRSNGAEVFDRTIDYLVLQLRRKLEINPSRPEIIRTEWGVGYKLTCEVIRGNKSET